MAHLLWTLLGNMGESGFQGAPESPTCGGDSLDDQQEGAGLGCHCGKSMSLLRALHVEGLPPTMTAAELSSLMAPYGNVQYAEAAPEAVKNETGEYTRKLHCYVVFTDHLGACQAKQVLQPKLPEQAGAADVLRVRFCKPQNVVPLCTPTFRAFVTAQWAQAAAAAKASPEYKKASCKVNALFVSKLHQHITTARLNSLFGKFGKMLACEVQYHSDGRSAGHGVVIYETIEDAEKALAGTNGYRLEGRTIEVTPLRLKKLPSKLEHLKNRIKRQPMSGDMSGSEDGSGSIPACSPKSFVSTPTTPAALMGLAGQQRQAAAAAAALHLQQGIVHGLQLHQQQLMLQQVQQQMAMQHMYHMMSPQLPVPCSMAAASAAAAAAAAMAPGGLGLPGMPPHSAMRGTGVPLGPGGMPLPGALHGDPHALPGMPMVRPNGEVVPPGLDLSFIS